VPPTTPQRPLSAATSLSRLLLACGFASALLYAAMLVFVPMRWEAYSSTAHTVSELSAIGAPTRSLWVPLGLIWSLLFASFGWGVWRAARGNGPLRVVGALITVYALFSLSWPPMHLREVLAAGGGTLTDTLHIVWTAVTGLLLTTAMAFGAAAFGKPFRVYSIVSIVLLLAGALLTSLDAARIQANLPTPLVGAWERVNIAAMLLWVAVLAVTVWRTPVARKRP
jgi:hypothetical protein